MEHKPLVSVIMPTYNSARFVAESIRSIQAQTLADWELLITDDCSTDNTVEIVEMFVRNDSRIKLFRLEKNSGGGVTRNKSISEAQGRYIALCDSDDRWMPDKLAKQIAFMEEKQCALSYSSYMTCDENGKTTGIVVCRNQETSDTIKRDNKIGCLTAIYDTEKIGKIYMPEIRKRQDWGLMIRVLQKCGIAYGMKEPLAIYRIMANSVSANKKSLIKYNVNLYREVLGWSKFRAMAYFFIVFVPAFFGKKCIMKLYNS